MSSTPKPSPETPDDDATPAGTPTFAENPPLQPGLEEKLQAFWDQHSRTIWTALAVILLAILAQGGFEYYQYLREQGIQKAYAEARTSDQLRRFAAEHPTHSLGGLAQLRLADEAYSAKNYAEAATGYDQAATTLAGGHLGGRAHIGAAIARLLAGKTAEAEKALSALAADTTQIKAVRTEAAYQLGSHLLATGRTEEGKKALEQAGAIDPTSKWAEKASQRLQLITP